MLRTEMQCNGKILPPDICYICDDDLNFIDGFQNIIKQEYKKSNYDIITFQAENEKGKKYFNVKTGKHNRFSVLKIWSWGITFRRKSIINNKILFNEIFGLGSKYPVGEENIFLTDCYKKGLFMNHCKCVFYSYT
ncbi:MAG: hypothetical protein Q9M97_06420 [Candidatus Gracilibacteria bacterium]|nr:hypothetical protein [Candidatus Gracilibacteria bacterium]